MSKKDLQRLEKILQGAFSGPPTPLKEVPTRWGKERTPRKPKPIDRDEGGSKPAQAENPSQA